MPNKALIAIVVVGLLASATGTAAPAVENDVHFTGTVQHARVTVSVVGESSIRQVATGETDGNGRFRVKLPKNLDRPLLLEIKPATHGRSGMVCDLPLGCGMVARNESTSLPRTFRMLSLVIPGKDDLSDISVNPFTHLATYQSLREEGMLGARTIHKARERIAEAYELDGRAWGGSRRTGISELRGSAFAGAVARSKRLLVRGGGLQVIHDNLAARWRPGAGLSFNNPDYAVSGKADTAPLF